MKVLIIEDDQDIADLLAYNFAQEKWQTQHLNCGENYREAVRSFQPNLLVLDLMLPDMSGLDICRGIKSESEFKNTAILILTAKGEEVDRVVGFELGADDYVVKPFSPRELILRIKSIMRRFEAVSVKKESEEISYGSLKIYPDKFKVIVGGQDVALTGLEFRILMFLVRMCDQVATREVLLEKVWGYSSEMTTRTVDTHIKRLREKLSEAGDHIETIRGMGYRFKEKLA